MARTVNPQRHAVRRLRIVDAAFTCFARDGYTGATTAQISRAAGIGPARSFPFPTKEAVLLAILELGTQETRAWFAVQDPGREPLVVIDGYVTETATAATDPRLAGFVRAAGAVSAHPLARAAPTADRAAHHSGLQPWVAFAQARGNAHEDLTAPVLTSWLVLVLDGYLGQIADDEHFAAQTGTDVLHDVIRRVLAPRPGRKPGRCATHGSAPQP